MSRARAEVFVLTAELRNRSGASEIALYGKSASGPVEIALQSVRAVYVSLGRSFRRRFVPVPVQIVH